MPFGLDNSTLLQQQQLYQSPAPPVFLVPVTAPVFAAPVSESSSCLPRAAAVNTATAPTWGVSPETDAVQPSYPYMSYNRNTGFWLQGFFFTSYEHLMAYRRCAIAYNYHFFGIRPHFRPPADLPRPRPPAVSSRAAVPDLAAVLRGPAVVGTGDIDSCSTEKSGEDGESFCCSPGGSSTCSNGDSDEICSDLCRVDADVELLCEAQQAAVVLLHEAAEATADPNTAAAVRNRISSSLETVAQRLAGLPSAPVSQMESILPSLGSMLVDWTAYAAAAASLAAAGTAPVTSSGYASVDEANGELSGRPRSRCSGVPLSLPLSPLRCPGASSSGGDAQGDVLSSACTAAGGSPTVCMCPQWLEPDLVAMLNRVVGEALWGVEDAA